MAAINISILRMRKLQLRKVKKLAEGKQPVSGSGLSSRALAQVLLRLPRALRQGSPATGVVDTPHVSVKSMLSPAD